jgi:S-(hydroxymethyl)glutathione dehydrogenase / alcohol dehydrogenase
MVRAVITPGVGESIEIREVEPAPLGEGDVRVRIAAAGVCHSDLSLTNGTIPGEFPVVLGHEAAGLVTELGPAVSGLGLGDHVILNWAPPCRRCAYCLRAEPWLCAENAGLATRTAGVLLDGEPVRSTLGLGSLAEEVVVPASAVVFVPEAVLLDLAALLGCAVFTGLGAVLRTAEVRAGESVAVIGLGGVGLSAIAGARRAGATPIFAIDRSAEKETLARALGADEFLLATDELARTLRTHTEGLGCDHVFDCVGAASTIRTAWSSARRGGHVTLVGVGSREETVSFNPLELYYYARTLTSSVYGSSDPERDLPALAAGILDGSLDLSPLLTHRIGLDGVAEAFARMEAGVGGRSVVVFDTPVE